MNTRMMNDKWLEESEPIEQKAWDEIETEPIPPMPKLSWAKIVRLRWLYLKADVKYTVMLRVRPILRKMGWACWKCHWADGGVCCHPKHSHGEISTNHACIRYKEETYAREDEKENL